MTKNIGIIISAVVCHVFFIGLIQTASVSAAEPTSNGNYYQLVPHIVLPETIQYKTYENVSPFLSTEASAARRPATYTAFPSYVFDEKTEFRTIRQVTYPITPVSPSYASAETVAEVWNNRQIVPTQQAIQKSNNPSAFLEEKQPLPTNTLQQPNETLDRPVEPKFTVPKLDATAMTSASPLSGDSPVLLEQVDQNKQTIRQVADKQEVHRKLKPTRSNDQASTQESAMTTPADSIVFVKRDKVSANISADTIAADAPAPLRTTQSSYATNDSLGNGLANTFENGVYGYRSGMFGDDFGNNDGGWLDRESLFMKQASYTQLAPPTQNGFMATGNNGYQPSPLMPGYSQNYGMGNGMGNCPCPNFGNNMPQQQSGGLFPVKGPGAYSTAGGLNDAWNSYFSAMASQQPAGGPSPRYQSLTQLGGMMPVMAGNGLVGANMNPGMMTVQPMMSPMMSPMSGMPSMMAGVNPAGMQQQTIGYIVLYPQSANSGVRMQLAQRGTDKNAGENANADNGENESAQNGEAAPAGGNNPQPPMQQMQAVFIPAASQQPMGPMMGLPDQYGMMSSAMNPMMMGMGGMGMMNPYMMNPYMMNPMMMNPSMNPMMMGMGGMGMMNPYMMNPMMMNPSMNPMMMGMGMPPIIIQMPSDSAPRRMGLFARLRAARAESQNRQQASTAVMGSLFNNSPERLPAKAAYPYGYFGASGTAPFQTGNFGGYHDMYYSKITYPGM